MLNQKAIDKLRAMGKGVATVSVAPADWKAIVDVLDVLADEGPWSRDGDNTLLLLTFRKMIIEVLGPEEPDADSGTESTDPLNTETYLELK